MVDLNVQSQYDAPPLVPLERRSRISWMDGDVDRRIAGVAQGQIPVYSKLSVGEGVLDKPKFSCSSLCDNRWKAAFFVLCLLVATLMTVLYYTGHYIPPLKI